MRVITPFKYFADHSNEWLAKETPDWFASAKTRRREVPHSQVKGDTIRSCPSFVDIFRNSLVLRAPTEMIFHFMGDANEYMVAAEFPNFRFVHSEQHDIETQMSREWGSQHIHLKLNFNFQFISEVQSKCLILPPDYHFEEESLILKPMLGVLDLLPNLGVEFNLNMIAGKQDFLQKKELFVRKGTPLAYLYFPFGENVSVEYMPQHEYESFHFTRTSFGGEYLRHVMKGKANGSL